MALMGIYHVLGVTALGSILLYLAAVGAWWAQGPLLSMLGVVAIGLTVLGVVVMGRLGLILTGLADSLDQQEGAEANVPLRWGGWCLGAMFLLVPMAAGFRDKAILAVALLALTVLANLAGIVLSGIGAWKAWRSGRQGKWQSVVALVWGVAPWVLAVFYFG